MSESLCATKGVKLLCERVEVAGFSRMGLQRLEEGVLRGHGELEGGFLGVGGVGVLRLLEEGEQFEKHRCAEFEEESHGYGIFLCGQGSGEVCGCVVVVIDLAESTVSAE